jgi:hypothetical protein
MTPRQQMQYMLAQSAREAKASSPKPPIPAPDHCSKPGKSRDTRNRRNAANKQHEIRIPKRAARQRRVQPIPKTTQTIVDQVATKPKAPRAKAATAKTTTAKTTTAKTATATTTRRTATRTATRTAKSTLVATENHSDGCDKGDAPTDQSSEKASNVKLVIKFRKESGEWAPSTQPPHKSASGKRPIDHVGTKTSITKANKVPKRPYKRPHTIDTSSESTSETDESAETDSDSDSDSDEGDLSTTDDESDSGSESGGNQDGSKEDAWMIRKCHACCEYKSVSSIRVSAECVSQVNCCCHQRAIILDTY